MELGVKLQVKPGQRIATVAGSAGVADVSVPGCPAVDDPDDADVVVAFVARAAELDAVAEPAVRAARADRLAWIAYPKAGKLGTDLNRDLLREMLAGRGVQPVRQVAVDEVWSALRFRPA